MSGSNEVTWFKRCPNGGTVNARPDSGDQVIREKVAEYYRTLWAYAEHNDETWNAADRFLMLLRDTGLVIATANAPDDSTLAEAQRQARVWKNLHTAAAQSRDELAAELRQAVEDWGRNEEQVLAENQRLTAEVAELRQQLAAQPAETEEPNPTTQTGIPEDLLNQAAHAMLKAWADEYTWNPKPWNELRPETQRAMRRRARAVISVVQNAALLDRDAATFASLYRSEQQRANELEALLGKTEDTYSELLRGMAARASELRRSLKFADAHVPQWERIIGEHKAEIERLSAIIRRSDAVDKHNLQAELKQQNRRYGIASATIGRLRGDLARARQDRDSHIEHGPALAAEAERLRNELRRASERHEQEVAQIRGELRIEEDNVAFAEKALHMVLQCCDGEQDSCAALETVYSHVRLGLKPPIADAVVLPSDAAEQVHAALEVTAGVHTGGQLADQTDAVLKLIRSWGAEVTA